MKNILKFSFTILIAICCFACDKHNIDGSGGKNGKEDVYYARFEATTNSTYIDHYAISFGEISYRGQTVRSISTTLGPASKGAKAYISATPANRVAIYISKNGGPYELNATGTSTASYTVNF